MGTKLEIAGKEMQESDIERLLYRILGRGLGAARAGGSAEMYSSLLRDMIRSQTHFGIDSEENFRKSLLADHDALRELVDGLEPGISDWFYERMQAAGHNAYEGGRVGAHAFGGMVFGSVESIVPDPLTDDLSRKQSPSGVFQFFRSGAHAAIFAYGLYMVGNGGTAAGAAFVLEGASGGTSSPASGPVAAAGVTEAAVGGGI